MSGKLLFNHGRPWTREEERQVVSLFEDGISMLGMVTALGRTGWSIAARLQKLGKLRYDAPCKVFRSVQTTSVWATEEQVRQVNERMGATNEPKPDFASLNASSITINPCAEINLTNLPASAYYVKIDNDGYLGGVTVNSTSANSFAIKESNHMNTIDRNAAICTVTTESSNADKKVDTYIYGTPAANVSDADIFNHIGNLEGKIAALDKITHKPKKLTAQIEAYKGDIAKLVEYVDSRA